MHMSELKPSGPGAFLGFSSFRIESSPMLVKGGSSLGRLFVFRLSIQFLVEAWQGWSVATESSWVKCMSKQVSRLLWGQGIAGGGVS